MSKNLFPSWLVALAIWLGSLLASPAFTTTDADTLFNAYHTTFFQTNGGNAYYKNDTTAGTGVNWWTLAEEIERLSVEVRF